MDTKISVIVPVYNLQNHIETTIESICNQTYRNLEIIIVDDGSQDNTPRIIDAIATRDARIYVIHKKNEGVMKARLTGVEVATGEWVGFVDGDDYIEPEMYQYLMYNARKYEADISHCGYQMIFPNRVDYYYNTGRVVEQDRECGLKDLLEGKFVEPSLCNKIFRRELLQKLLCNNIVDFSIKNTEDLLMNFYLFRESTKAIYTDQCYYHYMVRKHSAATSIINENKLRDPLRVLKILEKETKYNQKLHKIVMSRIVAQLINLSILKNDTQENLIRGYRVEARKELKKLLPQVLNGEYGRKQKVMALGVILCPHLYKLTHTIHANITGSARKYEVD